MKMLVTLQENESSKEFLEEIKELETKFRNLKITAWLPNLELKVEGNFYLVSTKNGYWVEDEDYVYLRIKSDLVKRLVIKEAC